MESDKETATSVSEVCRSIMTSITTSRAYKFLDVFSVSLRLADLDGLGLSCAPIRLLLRIREEYWLYKLEQYIRAFDDVPASEIDELAAKLRDDEAYRHRVGASLLELELLESDRKANWLGKLTLAYSRGVFDADMFDALRYGIRNTYAQDLQELQKFYGTFRANPDYCGSEHKNKIALQRLAGIGLLSGPSTALGGSDLYFLNEYGTLMVENALMDEREPE